MPVALSIVMFGILMFFLFAFSNQPPEHDEGVGAHLFQIWLAVEVLTVGFFALTEVPKAPRTALPILLVQILAVLIVCAPVFILNL